jgi:hypothetical protein
MPLLSQPESPKPALCNALPRAQPRSFNLEQRVVQEEQVPPENSYADVIKMASSKTGIVFASPLSYNDLIRPQTFQALLNNAVLTENALKRKCFYLSNLVIHLNKDIRDLGRCFPYVVEVDTKLPMAAKVFADTTSNLVISVVSNQDVDLHAQLASILVSRGLVDGSVQECTEDMKAYTSFPFYTLACFRDNILVGIAVFRCHTLNTMERMIQLELLATKLKEPPGVGTSLMKIIRGLSQVSPFHQGFVAAQTLRTAGARRFYARKLAECNSPLARSLLISLSCINPSSYLASHLDLRAAVVFPAAA